jgi:hypothetical protein
MALVICDNCGKSLLTEADLIISQHGNKVDYISCGCKEFSQLDYVMELIANVRECAEKSDNLGVNNALFLIEKKAEIRRLYGHEVASPENQKCGLCGVAAYTNAVRTKCPRRKQ